MAALDKSAGDCQLGRDVAPSVDQGLQHAHLSSLFDEPVDELAHRPAGFRFAQTLVATQDLPGVEVRGDDELGAPPAVVAGTGRRQPLREDAADPLAVILAPEL